jgi:hypothetical protein
VRCPRGRVGVESRPARHGETLLDDAHAAADRHRDLNAIAWVDWKAAARAADVLDAQARAGGPLGPLHGVPLTIKDLYEVAGMPTAGGTRAVVFGKSEPNCRSSMTGEEFAGVAADGVVDAVDRHERE